MNGRRTDRTSLRDRTLYSDRITFLGTALTVAVTAVGTALAFLYVARLAARARAGGAGRGGRWARPVLMTGAAAIVALCLLYQSVLLSKAPFPPRGAPPQEHARATEWQAWRAAVHTRLSAEPVTEEAVANALRVRTPPLDEPFTEADLLRRDQAVADVLLSYKGVRKILATRFGIRENFLGTGLSKPLGRSSYGEASVHEYLIDNHRESHDHVWVWRLDPQGRDISLPIRTLLAGEGTRVEPQNAVKPTTRFDHDLKDITLRVKNPDHPIPPMIRFARLDKVNYKGTVGRADASHAFTSNLSEVWELTVQQAAEKSGYYYRDGGDTLFIWVFVPYHSNEFTPATWRHVLERLPEWLERKSR